ncbi:hypothetical protein Scep_001506 [Stephania cephalantha]|uniref:Subtilisin-like protease n=1 Tax=Stephania cephalantha TaxID=152367 RepID=A0AAP0Q3U4_9MAGN
MASPSLSQCLLCFLLLSLTHSLAFSSSQQSQTYIIHMDVYAMPKVFTDHHSWYSATLSSISQHSSSPTATTTDTTTNPNQIYTYTHVLHGFSVRLSRSELSVLQSLPGFVSSIPDVRGEADTTRTPKFLGLPSGAWLQSNYGKGVVIGVLDSGVWPESKSYSDIGMSEIPPRWKGRCVTDSNFSASVCNKKLIGVQYFNKGVLAENPNAVTVNSSRDDDGHGTHTSTTAAGGFVKNASFFGYANGTAAGVAPLAHIAMYKVVWRNNIYASDVFAAVDQAIRDGVDVISISLSFRRDHLYEDPLAIASFAAMERGILVACSAGNRGSDFWTVRSGMPWAVTVGAGSVDREVGAIVTLGNGISIFGSSLFLRNSSVSQVPLVYVNECNVNNAGNIGNKIVVCTTYDYAIDQSISDVGNANVAGGIFILSTPTIERIIDISYPAAFVTPEEGRAILNYINKSSNPTARMNFGKTRLGVKPAPILGDYSARGPSPTCPSVLKPDIFAPGTLVLAAWPGTTPVDSFEQDYFSSFNIVYGTSMSTPHVAGVAALLKRSHPEWSPAAIRSAMMTTADSLDNTGMPIKDHAYGLRPADPLGMGAGHINPKRAMNPGLIYDANREDYVKFICSLNFTDKEIKTIIRSSRYNCTSRTLDLNYPSFIAYFNAEEASSNGTATQVFRRTVTNVGDAASTYTAKLADMGEVNASVKPKKLVFKRKNEKLSYTLTLKGPRRVNPTLIKGSLTWVEISGKYVVRSPILATRLNIENRFD